MILLRRLQPTPAMCGWVQAALVLAALLTSFIWVQKYELWCAGATLMLATIAYIFNQSQIFIPPLRTRGQKYLLLVMGAFGLLVWARGFLSDIPALSLLQSGFYCLPLLLALTLATMTDSARPREFILRGGYALLAMLAIGAAVQVALFDMPNNDRASWPLINANHLAMVMNVGIVFGLGLTVFAEKRQAGLVLLVLCAIGELLTGSRAGLLVIAAVVPVFFILMRGAWPFTRRQSLLGFLALLVIGVMLMLMRPGESSALYTFRELFTDPAGLMGSRPIMWAAVWDLITIRPWFGYGTGTFPAVYPQVITPAHLSGGYAAHNDFLQIWLELGVFGAMMYAAIGAMIVIMTLRALPRITDSAQRIQLVTAFCALATLFLHAQIEFMLGVLPLMVVSGILIGVWWNALPATVTVQPTPSRRMFWIGQVTGAVFLFMTTLSMTQTYAEIHLRNSDHKLRIHDIRGFAFNIDVARNWSLDLHAFPYLRAANFNLALLMSGRTDAETSEQDVQKQIDAAKLRNPYLSAVWETQGRIDQFEGRDPLKAWLKGLALEPRNASLRLLVLQYYERMGLGAEARAFAAESAKQWDLRGPAEDLRAALEKYEPKTN